MTRKSLWMVLMLFAWASVSQAATFGGAHALPEIKPMAPQAQAAKLAAQVLARHHYKPMPLDDALSQQIFERYLKSLDAERMFFLQSDIDSLASLRTRLDDAVNGSDLSPPFTMFNLYLKRAAERFADARGLLQQGFDFTKDEVYAYDRAKAPWAASEADMRDLWRKRVKNDWLRLKLSGKSDKDIARTLDKRYENSIKRIARLKSGDVFQMFMNAYTMTIEPHTNYLGPRAAEDFDISMRLSLVGIGAVLSEKDDYTTIRELVAGGPAARSGELKVGDRIVGVAQGANGAMTDVVGWRLDDTVALIRGTEDSVVVLDVLPADSDQHKRVTMVRKKIALEEQAAKKSIVSINDAGTPRRVGVIVLPTFYEDFEGKQRGIPNYRSASRDVARLLEELKAEHVDGVVMDLRNNGGGSLAESIKLTGLFVGKGPVVQQRDAMGGITVWRNTTNDSVWEGPLAVLINRGSASASEIFAAAIQDYGRGVVIGEPSFGKGTVQSVFSLDDMARNARPMYGELKLTIAQFFRINGGTTQLRGVTPDIVFPSAADTENFGESSHENALPWMRIRAADYAPVAELGQFKPALLSRASERGKSDQELACLFKNVAEVVAQRQKKMLPLKEAERRQQRAQQDAMLKSCAATAVLSGNGLRDDGLQADERKITADLANEKARKEAKDVLLEESARILVDVMGLRQPSPRYAAREAPSALQPSASSVKAAKSALQ